MNDDVLDNWEEIDEAGLTSTLQKFEAERKTQQKLLSTSKSVTASNADNPTTNQTYLISCSSNSVNNISGDFLPMKLLQRTPKQDHTSNSVSAASTMLKSPLDDMSSTFQPVMMVLHNANDEYQSANYTQPINSQTVKILRRPTQSSEPRNNGVKPRQPIKTLQQREQEYAEARLRILGSAKNPEDDAAASVSNVNSNSIITPAGSAATAPISPTANTTTPATAAAMTKSNSSSRLQSGQNIYLRMPRGPDGSPGFQMRR